MKREKQQSLRGTLQTLEISFFLTAQFRFLFLARQKEGRIMWEKKGHKIAFSGPRSSAGLFRCFVPSIFYFLGSRAAEMPPLSFPVINSITHSTRIIRHNGKW